MQAKLMWFMPLAFSVMFFFFPSGLVLYWITNNILSIATAVDHQHPHGCLPPVQPAQVPNAGPDRPRVGHRRPGGTLRSGSHPGAAGNVRSAPLVLALCGAGPSLNRARPLTCPFWTRPGQPIDQGLAIFFPAPHSFTGEDVLELQAHGGPVVLQLLLARCLAAAAEPHPDQPGSLPGCAWPNPGEFSQRAFLNDKIDLAQAEAIADLIDASTEAAARSASRSLVGEFSREVGPLREALIHLRMLVEATLDFPEEEIDFLQKADAQGQLGGVAKQRADGAGARAPGRAAARRHHGGDCRPAQCRQVIAAQRPGRRRAGHRHAHCRAPPATRCSKPSRSKACRCM